MILNKPLSRDQAIILDLSDNSTAVSGADFEVHYDAGLPNAEIDSLITEFISLVPRRQLSF